jgi:hypothetical protein
MQTLVVTMPGLERAARQWAEDFLHERYDAALVVTDLTHLRGIECENSRIILFERTPPEVLKPVLQNGGHPWLVSDIVSRVAQGTYYSM